MTIVGTNPDLSQSPDPVLPLLFGILHPVEKKLCRVGRATVVLLELREDGLTGTDHLVEPSSLEGWLHGGWEVRVDDVGVHVVELGIKRQQTHDDAADRGLLGEERQELLPLVDAVKAGIGEQVDNEGSGGGKVH